MAGQLSREEIEECSKDTQKKLKILKKVDEINIKERKNQNTRHCQRDKDRPDAILWLCKNASELTDGQISKLVGSTKGTVSLIRKEVIGIFKSKTEGSCYTSLVFSRGLSKKALKKRKEELKGRKKAKLKRRKKSTGCFSIDKELIK